MPEKFILRGIPLSLALSVTVTAAAALVGALATAPSIHDWYAALIKPSWTPPNWVFGPVWTMLYAMMAVAAWLAWRAADSRGRMPVLSTYLAQLALNSGWSVLFFGLRLIGLALIEIVVLWLAIIVTIGAFRRYSATAALLLIPYALWVGYAITLNFGIWRLNQ